MSYNVLLCFLALTSQSYSLSIGHVCHLVVVGAHCSYSWINNFTPPSLLPALRLSRQLKRVTCNFQVCCTLSVVRSVRCCTCNHTQQWCDSILTTPWNALLHHYKKMKSKTIGGQQKQDIQLLLSCSLRKHDLRHLSLYVYGKNKKAKNCSP